MMTKKRLMVRGASLVAATLLSGVTGCAIRQTATKLDPVAPPPANDAAMAYRSFDNTSAEYENTGVIAWSTRAPLVTPPGTPDAVRRVSEPVQFLGNVALMPVSWAVDPPFQNQYVYREGGTPRSHTAVPPFDSVAPADEGAITAPIKYGPTETAEALRRSEVVDVPPGVVVEGGGKGEGVKVRRVEGSAPEGTGVAAPAVPAPAPVQVSPSTRPSAAVETPAPARVDPLPPPRRDQPLPPPGDRSPLAPSVVVEPVPEGK